MSKIKILFLCTHNSARSIMAEALGNHLGSNNIECFSAGTHPSEVRKLTKVVLQEEKINNVELLSSKSINGFLSASFDYIVTTCDDAKDSCPNFPEKGIKLHWSLPDPSKAIGNEEDQLKIFRNVRDELTKRINILFEKINPDYF